MNRRFHVLQAPLDDAGTGGGSAGDGAGADGAGAGGDNGAGAGSGGDTGAGSALALGAGSGAGPADGGGQASGTPAAQPQQGADIPEKFLVKNAAGEIDYQATALKLAADGYKPLERRLGSGDARPVKVEDYQVKVPEALADRINAEQLSQDEGFRSFLAKMHEAGASQSVVDTAVAELLSRGTAMREAGPAIKQAECVATLREIDGWKTEGEFQRNMTAAYRAAERVFGNELQGMLETYGNDPKFVQAMAKLWPEMAEDSGASAEAQAQMVQTVESLMADPAYLNDRHPQHRSIVARVQAMQEQMTRGRSIERGLSISINR